MASRGYLALLLLAACGDDSSGNADANTVEPAVAHEVIACDTASWQVANPGQPDGYTCERACAVYVQHTSPSCAAICPDKPIADQCQSTFDYMGLRGCCYGNGTPYKFCECE
jgi:hypothetical protein